MFLATTALSEFWDPDKETLFLSSGCLLYDKSFEWKSLRHRVMPSPWNDRNRFSEAVRYLDDYYERLLVQLTSYLNAEHQVAYSVRYWRILLGPWLFHYLQAVYDRYIQLADAFDQCPELQTKVLTPQSFKVPTDTWEYLGLICDDALNLQVYSQLLQAMGYSFPTGTLRHGWPDLEEDGKHGTRRLIRAARTVRNWGIRLAEQGVSQALNGKRRVAMCDMYLPRSQIWKLALRTGFSAVPLGLRNRWSFDMPSPVSDERRQELANLEADDEFESLFVKILPENFPTLYLEGYAQARAYINKKFRNVPPVVASLVGWYFNEPFKFLAGEVSDRGGRLVAGQHGGGYGSLRSHPSERHEDHVADSYMVWGWASSGASPHRNLPSPKLSANLEQLNQRASTNDYGLVLLVATDQPRFLHRFHSFPVGGQCEDYIDWKLRFLAASPKWLRQNTLIRPFMIDHGWANRQRICDRFSDVQWDNGLSFNSRLKKSRIVIHDHPITTFAESMAANIPSMAFWDPHRWEMRKEAEPYYDRLRDAGILWHSPEEAAAKTAIVYKDTWEWWRSAEVQDARKDFVDRYAFAHKDWAGLWAKALIEEASLSRVGA